MSRYHQYLASEEWAQKRRAILKRDEYQCRVCCETERLEVHHRHYKNIYREDDDDLITLCHWCHEAITASVLNRSGAQKKAPQPSTSYRNTKQSITEIWFNAVWLLYKTNKISPGVSSALISLNPTLGRDGIFDVPAPNYFCDYLKTETGFLVALERALRETSGKMYGVRLVFKSG